MNTTFTRKDKFIIIFFAIIAIIGFIFFIIMDIKSGHIDADLVKYYKVSTYNGVRIYLIIFFVWWGGILGLVFYSFRGVWRNYKWRKRRPLLFSLFIIFIIYAFLNYPLYTLTLSYALWIVIESLGVFFILLFLKESM
ncbi:MAG TPA: hypothetical protein QF753_14790 [Victivallales bacterium]|nr:hypothetical protein [Victivallales bacterium]